VTLTKLAVGQTGIVERVGLDGQLGRRVRSLGFVAGTRIKVVRIAPLGDPIEFQVRGARLCLRASEAKEVEVRRVEQPQK
jgi:Fe2+ transport system protein FeoA